MKAKLFVCSCLTLLCAFAQPSGAQDPLDQLARDLSLHIVASGKSRIVVDTKFRCGEKCEGFDRQVPALVRSALMQSNPPFAVLTQQQLEPLLLAEGFQPIDYYYSAALRAAASKVDALFLSGSIKLKRNRVEVEAELQRAPKFKAFHKRKVAFERPAKGPGESPICEPNSNVCLADYGGITQPECIHCPNPSFTQEAINGRLQGVILILVTVTAQGIPADLKVVNSLGSGLDERSRGTIWSWRFSPARDSSGKAVASRTTVEVTFKQF